MLAAVPPWAAPASSGSPPLDADTLVTSASGATLSVAKGWWVTRNGDLLRLEGPERDVTLTLLEVKDPDAVHAIAGAWPRVQPGFARKVKQVVTPPPRDGWDAVTQVTYETTTQEARVLVAIARRKGDTQYITLLDGALAGVDRRGAQVNTAISSFKAPGLEEESFRGRTARVLDPQRLQALAGFIDDARQRAKVPGVAVAVVQGGKVVLEKGFGVRTLGKPEPVTPNTLFMIGSITKSLTSLMMARLVDEGRFTWETPLSQVFPAFSLADPEATRRLLMKHTVCACTGLPRQDMEFFFGYSRSTPEGRVAAMKSMKPTTAFGETFQYSNSMVSAGGYLAARRIQV
ncbi:MAG: beta-lactamase family protein [Deltaproteobacteria bacterium]|nr:beta-lactamase family protein [Deltaproteobacteria bacterium]